MEGPGWGVCSIFFFLVLGRQKIEQPFILKDFKNQAEKKPTNKQTNKQNKCKKKTNLK